MSSGLKSGHSAEKQPIYGGDQEGCARQMQHPLSASRHSEVMARPTVSTVQSGLWMKSCRAASRCAALAPASVAKRTPLASRASPARRSSLRKGGGMQTQTIKEAQVRHRRRHTRERMGQQQRRSAGGQVNRMAGLQCRRRRRQRDSGRGRGRGAHLPQELKTTALAPGSAARIADSSASSADTCGSGVVAGQG